MWEDYFAGQRRSRFDNFYILFEDSLAIVQFRDAKALFLQ
jgi:hypothetical protein